MNRIDADLPTGQLHKAKKERIEVRYAPFRLYQGGQRRICTCRLLYGIYINVELSCALRWFTVTDTEVYMLDRNGLLINSVLLGIGLAMDAFSVSLVNGLHETAMTARKICGIAGIFSFFQGFMPMLGWLLIHTALTLFQHFTRYIPWISLGLLLYIGGKMLLDGLTSCKSKPVVAAVGASDLFIQGVATSIDALSVGFTIAKYGFFMALASSLVIALVTFLICVVGLEIGKKAGGLLADKATAFGGILLIYMGFRLFYLAF